MANFVAQKTIYESEASLAPGLREIDTERTSGLVDSPAQKRPHAGHPGRSAD
jgi:hypothetical protein